MISAHLDKPIDDVHACLWFRDPFVRASELQRRGTIILMTEQMARPALKLVDRAYVIRGGEVRRSGAVSEIREEILAEEYL